MLTHYDLVTWSTSGSWTPRGHAASPSRWNVGRAQVIDGCEGLLGMKQGGRRLRSSRSKGYGQGGNGIRPGETLVFVVDAVQVVA